MRPCRRVHRRYSNETSAGERCKEQNTGDAQKNERTRYPENKFHTSWIEQPPACLAQRCQHQFAQRFSLPGTCFIGNKLCIFRPRSYTRCPRHITPYLSYLPSSCGLHWRSAIDNRYLRPDRFSLTWHGFWRQHGDASGS